MIWRDAIFDPPDLEQRVVATDNGKHRWLDMRKDYAPDLVWNGIRATHWFPIPDFDGPTERDANRQVPAPGKEPFF